MQLKQGWMILDSNEEVVDRCHLLFNFCTDETSERDISDGDDPLSRYRTM